MDFDWTRVRAFLASAEHGSFSAAAQHLGLSQPTVGRQVAALEQELEVVLFERLGRRLTLTAAGEQLVEHARAMGRAAQALELAAAGQAEDLEGRVTISCSDLVAAEFLPPVLAQIRRAFPAIQVDVLTTNDVSDLGRREADIAIRHARPTQPELVGRRILEGSASLYASPEYIERVGPFAEADDLRRAQFIGYDRSPVLAAMLAASGVELGADQVPVVAPSSLVQRALAQRGVGICVLMDRVAGDDLVAVLPDVVSLPVPTWLVCHSELRTTPRFRVVYDAVAEHLQRLR